MPAQYDQYGRLIKPKTSTLSALPPLQSTSPVLRSGAVANSSAWSPGMATGGGVQTDRFGLRVQPTGINQNVGPEANAGWGRSYTRQDVMSGANTDLTEMTNIPNQIIGGAAVGGGGGVTQRANGDWGRAFSGGAAPPTAQQTANFDAISDAQSRPGQVVPSQISPEAMNILTPATALALQVQAELEASRLNEGYAEKSAAMLATPQPGDTGPAFPSQYWASMKRAQEGDIRARAAMVDEQIREEGRNRNPMWTARMLKENADRATGDTLKAIAAIDRDMTTQSEEARLNRARAYLDLNKAQPYQGTSWTTGEDYMRGAGYEDQLMAIQQQLADQTFNAGGGAPTVTQVGGGMPAIRTGRVGGLPNSVPAGTRVGGDISASGYAPATRTARTASTGGGVPLATGPTSYGGANAPPGWYDTTTDPYEQAIQPALDLWSQLGF